MKKLISSILSIILAIPFTACQSAKEEKPAMYIEKAQLTEEETDIVELLGADNGQHIDKYLYEIYT